MAAIQNLARSVLYGKKANTITLNSVARASFSRMVGGEKPGQPTIGEYAIQQAKAAVSALMGIRNESTHVERLPAGWPSAVFQIAAKEIAEKGGAVKLPEGQIIPSFRLVSKGAKVLPNLYVANIQGAGDYDKVSGLGDAIKEALAQAGMRYSVRVVPFPLRVEIDRPDAEIVMLADAWEFLKRQKRNSYEYATGYYFQDGKLQIGLFDLFDSREWSGIIAGASGSGKSQFCMSMLLSMCFGTSPEYLTLVLGDPKCADILALDKLPHLAYGRILSEIGEIESAVKAVEAEMDRRIIARDKSIVRKRIVLFLDEWADIAQLDKDGVIATAIGRLCLKGRFWGINVFLASQKTTAVVLPTLILANLAVRFCLRVNSFDEAKFVSGQSGCYAHKLPGNGAFLLYNPYYNEGQREQGFYIGDPASPEFDNIVGGYMADIIADWGNVRPHWQVTQPPAPEMVQEALPLAVTDDEGSDAQADGGPDMIQGFPQEIYRKAIEMYTISPDDFSVSSVRKLSKHLYGSEYRHDRAKRLHELIMGG